MNEQQTILNVLQPYLDTLLQYWSTLQRFLAENHTIALTWDVLCLVIPCAFLLAFTGMGFMSATARIFAVTRKRSSYEKCSRQLAFLGMMIGWGLLAGSRVWIFFQEKRFPPEITYLIEMSWLLLSLAVMLSSIYFVLWRLLKNMPVLHMTVGLISAVQACLTLVMILLTARFLAAFVHPEAATLTMEHIIPMSWDAPCWTAACYSLPLVFAMPAAFGSLWLVLRRNREDFGRDYYNTMIPWCAAWARNAWTVLWLILLTSGSVQMWLQWQSGSFDQQSALLDCARILLWAIPALLWAMVCRSAIAMRHKITLLLALAVAAAFTLPWYLELTSF